MLCYILYSVYSVADDDGNFCAGFGDSGDMVLISPYQSFMRTE